MLHLRHSWGSTPSTTKWRNTLQHCKALGIVLGGTFNGMCVEQVEARSYTRYTSAVKPFCFLIDNHLYPELAATEIGLILSLSYFCAVTS
ncbi:hypothetical protein RJT34_12183 [Clitoria ternatea]|uniref:Uncharacterized protein n=1 Tax=Clitoria ternatea TaxID=43366 RepID=A0AAN9PL51_CLITE